MPRLPYECTWWAASNSCHHSARRRRGRGACLPASKEVEPTPSPMGKSKGAEKHIYDLEKGSLGQVAEVLDDAGSAHESGQLEHSSQQECC